MSTTFNRKIACVTGGLNGIGYQFAKSFIKNGIKGIVLGDIQDSVASETISKLEEYGPTTIKYVHTDLMTMFSSDCIMKKTVEEFGQLDYLVNNAGILSEFDFERMIQVNYVSVLYGTMLALYRYMPKYKSGEEGIIINTASIFGIQPGYSLPVYTACKHAVVGIGRTFGADYYYNRYKSKVLTICPGYSPSSVNAHDNTRFDAKLFAKEISNYPSQRNYYCGKCLMKMLENPQNGSVWIAEGEECYQYSFEDRFQVRNEKKETTT